jgi:hypothetical protein
MNCCDSNGVCTQGADCPIRKQRIKEINDAYVKGFLVAQEDQLDDVFGTFKALIIVLAVCIAVTLLSYVLWGKV